MKGLLILALAWLAAASPQAGYSDAVAWVQQSRNDLAIPALQNLLTKSPGDLKARNLLGIALLNSGRREEAAAEFMRAIAIDPNFVPSIKNLGIAEVALGRRKEARVHFEQVLKLAPNDVVCHLNLGELHYADKRYTQALAHYKQTGGLYLKDMQVALRALRSAVYGANSSVAIEIGVQVPNSAEAQALLAQAYEQAGDT